MNITLEWLISSLLGIFIAFAGMFRWLMALIQAGDDELHARINQTRDEYARRADVDAHITRIERQLGDMRAELKEGQKSTTDRLDALLIRLSGKS